MEQKQAIVAVREGIDRIDDQIVSMLKERIGFAKEIGKLKDEGKRAKWDPLRERQIYERLFKLNGGVFPEKALHSIFHEIITSCRLSQKRRKSPISARRRPSPIWPGLNTSVIPPIISRWNPSRIFSRM